MTNYLDFEKGLAELQGKAEELRALARQDASLDVSAEADQLEARGGELLRELYSNLTPWQKCQIARHPERPHAIDYVWTPCLPITCRWPVTGTLPRTMRSSEGSRGSAVGPSS